jgi:serine/threonine-protein kinase
VSVQTDIYGTGTVLYELLTGRDPFFNVEGYFELLEAHVSAAPPTPSSVAQQAIDPILDAIVLRALAKEPELRFESARTFSDALAAAVELRRASTYAPHVAVTPHARGSLAVGVFVVLGSAILSALIALLIGRAL